MEPPSKRIHAAAEDDRLSDLPDSLIHTILSFLESRQVVRSSVLSRRWRHLWRSVPCLDVDLSLFRRGDRCQDQNCCKTQSGQVKTCKKEWQPFEEFSNNLFLLNDARSLEKLRMHVSPALDDCDDGKAMDACTRWVTRGVQCSPAVIDIHVDFSLGSWFVLPDLSSSRLTTLLLHGVRLGGTFAEQLRSGCPVLEELSLTKCAYHSGQISSTSLRHLTLAYCSACEGMVVTAPRLTSLRTTFSTISCPDGIYVTADTSSFVKASVRVMTFGQTNANFWEKLCSVFNVMHLELFGATMEKIQWASDKVPKFQNVRTLVISRCILKWKTDIQALDRFLQTVPGLKKLTFQDCKFSYRSKRRTSRAKWRHVALENQNLMSFKCDNLELIFLRTRKRLACHFILEERRQNSTAYPASAMRYNM